MTDNCDELRDALGRTWPNATLILCTFHLLQQVWRWLHDRKNSILMQDRPHILLLFKSVLYAENEDDMESFYGDHNGMEDDIFRKYDNLRKYIKDVYSDRELWALCYRKTLPIRGNNTNNYCEAQFLVIKDDVLNRQKEVNVNGLVDKFTTAFDDHYKNKLLSVASGKFDGIYSKRFKGIAKKNGEGVGYRVPNQEEQKEMLTSTVTLGHNTFLITSASCENTQYLVDMNSGLCQCKVEVNGSPCKHQYVLWVNKMATCTNFLPFLYTDHRKLYAEIAIGKPMPRHYYEGLHDEILNVTNDHHEEESILDEAMEESNDPVTSWDNSEQGKRRVGNPDPVTVEDCKIHLNDALDILLRK